MSLPLILDIISTIYPLAKELKKYGEFEARFDDNSMTTVIEVRLKNTNEKILTVIAQTSRPQIHELIKSSVLSIKSRHEAKQ